jgi:hypothetical protein
MRRCTPILLAVLLESKEVLNLRARKSSTSISKRPSFSIFCRWVIPDHPSIGTKRGRDFFITPSVVAAAAEPPGTTATIFSIVILVSISFS